MDKRTGTIITIVLGVIFFCCALFSCIGAITTLTGNATFNEEPVEPMVGLAGVCLAIIFIAIPVAAYFFLVRGKNGATTSPPAM